MDLPGIGKTTLVTGTLAPLPLNSVTLDGRRMEPTVPGALAAFGAALRQPAPSSATAAAERIAAAGVESGGSVSSAPRGRSRFRAGAAAVPRQAG